MNDFFFWVEGLGLSTFVRESNSIWGFPMFLFMHTLGLSIVAGGSAVISFALLGIWPRGARVSPLDRLYPLIWIAFLINLFTGVGLLMADMQVRAYNPDFWIKIALVIAGVVVLIRIRRQVLRNPQVDTVRPPATRMLAWASLFCWFGAIVAGRLIAYVGPSVGL
jgi:hypothetical protein